MTTRNITAQVECECGELTGERCAWTGPLTETEVITYMSEHLRSSHVAAGNSGTYPRNGAQRIRVERSCAERLIYIWEDGEQTDRLDPWVSRVA